MRTMEAQQIFKKAHISYDKGMLIVDTKAYGNHDDITINYDYAVGNVTVSAQKRIVDDMFKFIGEDDSIVQKYISDNFDAYDVNPFIGKSRQVGSLWKKVTVHYFGIVNMFPVFKIRRSVTYISSNYLIII